MTLADLIDVVAKRGAAEPSDECEPEATLGIDSFKAEVSAVSGRSGRLTGGAS